MHHSLTSREQDLAAFPKHQALLKALGVGSMAKSQTHAAALHESLRRGSNDHAHNKAPRDPKGFIRRASPDMTLTPAQRKADERAEKEYLRKMSEARANGGITDDDLGHNPEDEMPLKKGGNAGKFSALQKLVAAATKSGASDVFAALQSLGRGSSTAMAKAIAAVDASGEDFEARYGVSGLATAHAVAPARAAKASSTITPKQALAKSFKRVSSLMKAMDLPGASSLEASYGTDSTTLTGGSAIRKQSLPAKPAKPRYSAEQILKAASAALHAGAISGADAQAIQHQVNLRGTCDEALLKKLRGDDSGDAPATLNDSQARDACMKGMQSGAVTAAEAMHCDVALSLNQPIDGGLMDRLRQIHILK